MLQILHMKIKYNPLNNWTIKKIPKNFSLFYEAEGITSTGTMNPFSVKFIFIKAALLDPRWLTTFKIKMSAFLKLAILAGQ